MVVQCGCGWLVCGSRGLASLGPFLGAIPWCRTTDHGRCGGDSACAHCTGADRGMPVPQIMLGVEVACYGVLPLVQFLDKVADMPVASMTGAWGRQC